MSCMRPAMSCTTMDSDQNVSYNSRDGGQSTMAEMAYACRMPHRSLVLNVARGSIVRGTSFQYYKSTSSCELLFSVRGNRQHISQPPISSELREACEDILLLPEHTNATCRQTQARRLHVVEQEQTTETSRQRLAGARERRTASAATPAGRSGPLRSPSPATP